MKKSAKKVNTAIIVGAGSGKRLRAKLPKVFIDLAGRPMIYYSLKTFENCRAIDKIVLVVPRSQVDKTRLLLKKWDIKKVRAVVEGGKERQDSVWHGLQAIGPDTANILIHDGARPFVTARLINRIIKELGKYPAAIPGSSVKESLKRVKTSKGVMRISETPDRAEYFLAQTPQGFRRATILKAYELAQKEQVIGTDEAMLVSAAGQTVIVVPGEEDNIKITTPTDLFVAGSVLKNKPKS